MSETYHEEENLEGHVYVPEELSHLGSNPKSKLVCGPWCPQYEEDEYVEGCGIVTKGNKCVRTTEVYRP